MPPLRALMVDVGNTLVDFRAMSIDAYRAFLADRLCQAFGAPLRWFSEVPVFGQLGSGPPDWKQRNREAVRQMLRQHGVRLVDRDYERIRAACAAELTDLAARGLVRVDDSALAPLREAKGLGLRMVVCSNTPWTGAREAARDWKSFGLGDCFEGYVTSYDVGFYKPHPAMFQRALEILGVSPGEAAMVGDDLEADVVGAHALGIRTIWSSPDGAAALGDPPPDATIASFNELPQVLQVWL